MSVPAALLPIQIPTNASHRGGSGWWHKYLVLGPLPPTWKRLSTFWALGSHVGSKSGDGKFLYVSDSALQVNKNEKTLRVYIKTARNSP